MFQTLTALSQEASNRRQKSLSVSSEDQVGPWVYGLWKVFDSGAMSEEYKEKIKTHLRRQMNGLIASDFLIPTEWDKNVWGGLRSGDFRACAKLLGSLYTVYAATGDKIFLEKYNSLAVTNLTARLQEPKYALSAVLRIW